MYISYNISICTSSIFYIVRQAEYSFISVCMVRGSGGPILRIAGVSPAMLSACKSPGRYHLTLIGPNPETGSIPMRFQTRYFSRFLHHYSSRNYAVLYRVTMKQCLRFSSLKKRIYPWRNQARVRVNFLFCYKESCFVRLRRK